MRIAPIAASLTLAASAADVWALKCDAGDVGHYAESAGTVLYYRDRRPTPVTGADPHSFRVLEGDPCATGGYASDRNSIYYRGVRIPDADRTSFRVLSHGYAKDKSAVYSSGRRVQDADPGSFQVPGTLGIGHDKYYGYRDGKPVCTWTKGRPANLPLCDDTWK